MDKMVDRSRKVDGVGTSLLDLGFDNCGLDDNWQACGTGTKGTFYDGVTGRPLVNLTTFPSLKGMAAHGHKAGLNVGWYLNTCICGVGPGTFDGNQVRPRTPPIDHPPSIGPRLRKQSPQLDGSRSRPPPPTPESTARSVPLRPDIRSRSVPPRHCIGPPRPPDLRRHDLRRLPRLNHRVRLRLCQVRRLLRVPEHDKVDGLLRRRVVPHPGRGLPQHVRAGPLPRRQELPAGGEVSLHNVAHEPGHRPLLRLNPVQHIHDAAVVRWRGIPRRGCRGRGRLRPGQMGLPRYQFAIPSMCMCGSICFVCQCWWWCCPICSNCQWQAAATSST
jgi:hypothetical protein